MSDMDPNLPVRKCHCAGNCVPRSDQISRREFIGLVGASGAAALLANSAWAAFELPADQLDRWRKGLSAPTEPRRYLSGKHTDARMHLGGIGTGNFEIGVDGQLTTWQLFNTLRDGQVPLHFAVKSGANTRLLQTVGGPDLPRIKQITMTGEYPLATLRFSDTDLPVEVELTAFSPFAPLDSHFSAMPLAAFVFRVHNRSSQKQTVSLAAFMQNPVGYDAAGRNDSWENPWFGSNVNESLAEGVARGILMRAEPGREARLDSPVTLVTLANLNSLNAPPPDRPDNLKVQVLKEPKLAQEPAKPSQTVIWLEEPPTSLGEDFLQSARAAVQTGATLVFSGKSMPLLDAFGSWTGGKPVAQASTRPDIVFEDFEHGYGSWKVEGEAFGPAPAKGTLPAQQAVSGFLGKGLVNTFLHGDDTTGRLTSRPFRIERRFIRFLVGGGHHERTQIRLLVDNKIVHALSGKDNERLEPAVWDVAAFEGKTGHIEIVDNQKGPWGHINIDQIEFSDLPGNRGLMQVLEDLLPIRFSGVGAASGPGTGPGLRFADLTLKPGATPATMPKIYGAGTRYEWTLGKGRVVVVPGPVLDPAGAAVVYPRQRAYEFLCGLVKANYEPCLGPHPKAPGFGSLALAALDPRAKTLLAFEDWKQAWQFISQDLSEPANPARPAMPTPAGRTIYGAVGSGVEIPAGESAEVPFVLAWHYPNKFAGNTQKAVWMGCHYATQWPDARAIIRQAGSDFQSLRKRTERFRQAVYDSTLPYWLLDCLTANSAIIRHIGVVFRIANGDVYGWEGSNGCCTPTCTHVWGYEQTLAHLFPDLEREMRRIDFKHQQRPDGGVNNRTQVPSPPHPTGERPFADGHASCVLKAYREALNSPDEKFFTEYWPHIKRAVEYLIGRDARDSGGQPAGILQDDQWNTYDEALHGVTTFISGYYLAALRAGEEWARRAGDADSAVRFREIFERGQKKLIELCWNGEYFQQHLPGYEQRRGEVGPGCMSDQLIGQWWAHQLGLGYLLPKEMVVAALRAVYKYNFKTDLTGWHHSPRAFAGEKDKGLIICTWPKGGRPAGVMLYSDEVWTGIEYQVAAHMIYEDLLEEGLAIVKGARERYDGVPRAPIPRNPWNEIECGGHYARAMSSWSLLLALSGWKCDGPRDFVRVAPRCTPENFKSFFAGPEGWGTLRQSRQGSQQRNELVLVEGKLKLRELALVPPNAPTKVSADIGGRPVKCSLVFSGDTARVSFTQPLTVAAGEILAVTMA